MRFRSRIKGQDKVAALTYFRNIVEAHANGSLEDSTIRDIVGLDASKNLQFEHSLRVIPEHQLLDIHWDKPIGQGKNGAVYAGIWRKPVGHLATTRAGERDMKIVLKDVLPRSGTSEEPLKKLLKEVRPYAVVLSSVANFYSWILHTLAWVVVRLDVLTSWESPDWANGQPFWVRQENRQFQPRRPLIQSRISYLKEQHKARPSIFSPSSSSIPRILNPGTLFSQH